MGLIALSRVGVYIRLPGVDVDAFAANLAANSGVMGYVDTLSGGSISKVTSIGPSGIHIIRLDLD